MNQVFDKRILKRLIDSRTCFLAIISLLLFLGKPSFLFSQEKNVIKFRHLTIEDGLSQSIVNSVAQDQFGFIWIGTEDGLNRYNGLDVEVFQTNPNDSTSISGNWIHAIFLDSKQNLWIGTDNGLSLYNQSTENFIQFRNNPQDSNSVGGSAVLSICEYENDLWIGTKEGGISKFDFSTRTFSHYKNQLSDEKTLPSNQINVLLVDRANVLWAGTADGLARYDSAAKSFTNFKSGENYRFRLPSNNITSLHESEDAVLWVGTSDGGMSRFNPNKTRLFNYLAQKNIHEMMKQAGINIAKEDSRGDFWIGTSQGLLRKQRGVSESDFTAIQNSSLEPNSLNNNNISTIFEDSSGLIWIGTKGGGVNIYDSRQKKFEHYKQDYKNENSLSKNRVLTIFEESRNKIWIGLEEGGLSFYDRKNQTFESYKSRFSRRDSLWATNVTAIAEDKLGRLWVGTAKYGLNVLEANEKNRKWNRNWRNRKRTKRSEKKWIHFQSNSKSYSISSNQIRKIFSDKSDKKNGDLWILTSNGLNRLQSYDSAKFVKYQHFASVEDSLNENPTVFQTAMQDEQGSFWVGTENGKLLKFNPATEIFREFSFSGISKSANKATIFSIKEQGNFIWIGTDGNGLVKFDKEVGKAIASYGTQDGLCNNTIYGIESDKMGSLWISTKKGLAFFDSEKGEFVNYYAYHGLQSNIFLSGSSHKGKFSDRMYFGGINGLTIFSPKDIEMNPHLPKVYITSLKINNRTLTIQPNANPNKDAILRESILLTNSIKLNYSHKYVHLDFVALDYSNPSKNKYKYKLEPFDKEWIETNAYNAQASYTNLPAGEYTFKVIASNNDNVWNETPTELEIVIHPAWWETVVARAGFILLGIALISILFRLRTRRLESQQRKLQRKVEVRTAEIKEKNEELEAQQKKILKQTRDIESSILYAERILTAILPMHKNISKLLPDYFVLFKPRNIVSGDFYWMAEKDGKTIIAVVDCTGHGIPGAFMSIIGADLLKEIVKSKGILDPAMILLEMDKGVRNALQQEEFKTRDGMDVSIVVLEKLANGTTQVEFAGAHNSMTYIQGGKINVLKANRDGIGGFETKKKPFLKYSILIDQPTEIYLATDGYQDQFGGEHDKKILRKNFKKLLLENHSLPMCEQKEILETYFLNWKGDTQQTDDVLVFGFRVNGL